MKSTSTKTSLLVNRLLLSALTFAQPNSDPSSGADTNPDNAPIDQ